jgi:protein gp37
MAENSGIEWTDHTFNPWWGCTKISPACDNCYAEALDKRTGGEHWGPKAERRRTSKSNWAQPLKWNKQAQEQGVRVRVFCASMADVFDNQVPDEWRDDLWELIFACKNIDWLLLTKRPQNIEKMLPNYWGDLGAPNVWLGTTVEDQKAAAQNIPHLLDVPARVHFLSCEPLLGPIEIPNYLNRLKDGYTSLDWVICGGESGPNARPMHPDWARDLRDQCQSAGVPFFFKQWGEWAPGECAKRLPTRTEKTATFWNGTWDFGSLTPKQSEEMHRDDAPDLYRLGKKNASRTIDGETWDQFPKEKVAA